MIDARAILDFWFGDIRGGWVADAEKPKLWFGGKSEKDAEIKRRFGAMIDEALDEEESSAAALVCHAEALMARIILLDQMTRMVCRGEARAFAGDGRALLLCRAGLQSGADKTLPPVYRLFFYLPLEHSEKMEDQHLCVSLFSALPDEYPQFAEPLAATLEYAVKHRDIIARFGRFPHRNRALGRTSTAEEAAYLKTAETFGQG
ncbi:MAG: DUF924 family protein [Gammaproteobacteria bacterium]